MTAAQQQQIENSFSQMNTSQQTHYNMRQSQMMQNGSTGSRGKDQIPSQSTSFSKTSKAQNINSSKMHTGHIYDPNFMGSHNASS